MRFKHMRATPAAFMQEAVVCASLIPFVRQESLQVQLPSQPLPTFLYSVLIFIIRPSRPISLLSPSYALCLSCVVPKSCSFLMKSPGKPFLLCYATRKQKKGLCLSRRLLMHVPVAILSSFA